jgi:hypothetical protein
LSPGNSQLISDKAYAEVIAAMLMVEVVYEGSFLAVVEQDPDHAEAAGERRMFFLDDFTPAPGVMFPVFDPVAQLEI